MTSIYDTPADQHVTAHPLAHDIPSTFTDPSHINAYAQEGSA